MRLIAKAIRISLAKFHCNRLITVQNRPIQDYASLIFGTHCAEMWTWQQVFKYNISNVYNRCV